MYRRGCSGQQKAAAASLILFHCWKYLYYPQSSARIAKEKEKPIPHPPRSTEIEKTSKPITRTLCSPTSSIVSYDSFVFRVVA